MELANSQPKDRKLIDTLQSIELAEGVEVQNRVAGVFPRAIALLFDMFMIGVFFVVFLILVGLFSLAFISSEAGLTRLTGVYLIFIFMMLWFYHFFFERGVKAATLGKRMMGLKVVSVEGTRATAKQAFVRNILRAADILPGVPFAYLFLDPMTQNILSFLGFGMVLVGSYGVGLISCLATKRFQRVGDLVAGTIVVHDKPPVHAVAPLPTAADGKMPRLPILRDEEVAIRNFCERAGIWSAARRVEMAQQASELTDKVGQEAVEELMANSKWIVERK